MGALTEIEIFDRMSGSLRTAHQCALDLATIPNKGPTYDRLRKELLLIEGCCRQASAWREDTRWLPIGLLMAECHKRAGNMLRGAVDEETGQKRMFNQTETHRFFSLLADNLCKIEVVCNELRTKATGRTGMILPDVKPGPHRDTRPEGWRATQGGLLIPSAA